MKKYKKLLILLGVLIVIVTAVIIISNLQKKQEAIRVSGETILTVPRAIRACCPFTIPRRPSAF